MAKPQTCCGSIVVDAMGADLGAAEVVRATALAFDKIPELDSIILVGKERLLKKLIDKAGLGNESRLHIHGATEVIEMGEKPIQSLKQKKDSSLARAIELVQKGQGDAVVSCGNTGSLMACGTLRLRPMKGVERPAIATIMPNKVQHFILIDAGANPSAKPEHLLHNAILGSHYARVVLQKKKPRIGLLSIGTEEGKGNELVSQTHELLKQVDGIINYNGLLEGFQVFNDKVDVIVCDGFTGNVLLKTCESLFMCLKDYLKDEITKTPLRMAGAFLSKGAFKNMKKQFVPDQYGGAPLLGLNGNILKAHGSSNHIAIMNAIRIASELVAHDMNAQAQIDVIRANETVFSQKEASAASN